MKPAACTLGTILLCLVFGCNQYNGEEAALSDSTSVYGLTGDDVKMVKKASVNTKVKNVDTAAWNISMLASECGGMVFERNIYENQSSSKSWKLSSDSLLIVSNYSPSANIIVRVPTQTLDYFVFSVTALGYQTNSSHLSLEDKSLDFIENKMKSDERTGLLESREVKQSKPETKLNTVKLSDNVIDRKIENRKIEADARYSTVNIYLHQNTQVRKEVVANADLRDYRVAFWPRLVMAIHGGVKMFADLLIGLMYLWVFIVLGVGLYLVLKNRKRIAGLK